MFAKRVKLYHDLPTIDVNGHGKMKNLIDQADCRLSNMQMETESGGIMDFVIVMVDCLLLRMQMVIGVGFFKDIIIAKTIFPLLT
jgi:hypothetical protein